MPYTKTGDIKPHINNSNGVINFENSDFIDVNFVGDKGSASRYFKNCQYTKKDEDICRYFYSGKASKKDRDSGLDMFESKLVGSLAGGDNDKEILDDVLSRFRTLKRNIHPTCKPIELMQYLVRLVSPKGAIILDPFMGSGSTGKAVMYENKERQAKYKFIGMELTDQYLPIAEARIKDAEMDTFEYNQNNYKQENNKPTKNYLF